MRGAGGSNCAAAGDGKVRNWLERVGESPFWFHHLRKLPELNYRATKARIARVRDRLGRPRVLDVGCGTGEFCRLFDPAGYLGVDRSEGYVRYARRLNPERRFECADVTTWPGCGERFDLVLVNGVLHHADEASALAILRAALSWGRPGATLLVIEDSELPGPGLLTRLVHGLDAGHFIRTPEAWRALVGTVVPVEEVETYVSGVCPYTLLAGRTR
jgi:SAM-dependent methyltransferase